MANKPSNHFMYNILKDFFDNNNVRAIAIASGGAHTFVSTNYDNLADAGAASDITAHEFDGAGYTVGGVLLANVIVTEDDTNNLAKVDCDDFIITSLSPGTNDIEGWLFVVDAAGAADRKIIGWFGYATAQAPNGNNFTVEISVDGFLRVRKAA